jgi:hypothetical protein
METEVINESTGEEQPKNEVIKTIVDKEIKNKFRLFGGLLLLAQIAPVFVAIVAMLQLRLVGKQVDANITQANLALEQNRMRFVALIEGLDSDAWLAITDEPRFAPMFYADYSNEDATSLTVSEAHEQAVKYLRLISSEDMTNWTNIAEFRERYVAKGDGISTPTWADLSHVTILFERFLYETQVAYGWYVKGFYSEEDLLCYLTYFTDYADNPVLLAAIDYGWKEGYFSYEFAEVLQGLIKDNLVVQNLYPEILRPQWLEQVKKQRGERLALFETLKKARAGK